MTTSIEPGSLLVALQDVPAFDVSSTAKCVGYVQQDDTIVVLTISDKTSKRIWSTDMFLAGSVLWNGSVVYVLFGLGPKDFRRFKPL